MLPVGTAFDRTWLPRAAGILFVGLPAMLHLAYAPPSDGTRTMALVFAVWVGFAWSIVNLLPVLPLDGGNIARCLLERAMGKRGVRVAHQLSIAIAATGA